MRVQCGDGREENRSVENIYTQLLYGYPYHEENWGGEPGNGGMSANPTTAIFQVTYKIHTRARTFNSERVHIEREVVDETAT